MKKKAYLTRCILSAMVVGTVYCSDATPAFAEDLDNYVLDEIVITAARTETKAVDTPANITVVDAEKIESRRYQDVSEVLKDVPGINVLDRGAGAFEKNIILNGDDRVLILVDGRRVNFGMGTVGSGATYDLNQMPDVSVIERIEVMKGGGGALYGSDAVGGVINIITKKIDMEQGKVSLGAGSSGARDMNAMYTAKNGKTGFMISASQYKQDYYKYKDIVTDTTKRWPDNSEFENKKISLKVTQDLTDTSDLEVGYDYSKFEGYNPYSTTMPYLEYLSKKTENIHVKYNWMLKDQDQGYFQLYRNKYEYYNQCNMEEKTIGFDVQQALSLSDTNKLVVGASYRDSEAFNEIYYSQEQSIDNLAFFINDTWEFAPTWTLNAGVRYDDHSKAGNETTMSAGLNKKFDENSHAYFNWSEVFRAPTIDDLFYFSDMGQYGQYKGNPDLNPETGDTWTLGYNTKLNDKTSVGVSYFRSDLDDAIDWDYTNNPIYAKNIDRQKKRGMELNVRHELNDNVDLEASYTYVRVENNENNTGFVRDYKYVPNIYRVGVRYHEAKWDTNLSLRYGSGADTASTWFDSYGNKYGNYIDSNYLAVDLAVSYKASDDLTFYVKGYNLTNEKYTEISGHTNGAYDQPAQARFFVFGAEYSF